MASVVRAVPSPQQQALFLLTPRVVQIDRTTDETHLIIYDFNVCLCSSPLLLYLVGNQPTSLVLLKLSSR